MKVGGVWAQLVNKLKALSARARKKPLHHTLVLLDEYGTGGIGEDAALPHPCRGRLQNLELKRGELVHVSLAKRPRDLWMAGERARSRARSIDEDQVKRPIEHARKPIVAKRPRICGHARHVIGKPRSLHAPGGEGGLGRIHLHGDDPRQTAGDLGRALEEHRLGAAALPHLEHARTWDGSACERHLLCGKVAGQHVHALDEPRRGKEGGTSQQE